ncbi:MAG: TIGR03088 family PEP-CTERM/XrtA system glycosyltransferase [Burkholderiaceae bacterium]|jgi:sugar transferase (PEP-CTERM/EpsH1 system associated)|nr:TIGR03088 family PEP-CTERM/XrtA system glycosyltransferase [Burkholderiaceae bacterium]
MNTDPRPLIAHVVYRFAVGGLENGVVNLINRLPAARWRHVVVALTEAEPAMRARIQRSDVRFVELRKPPGHLWRDYPRIVRLLRELDPAVVHTRNLAALEAQPAARLAGVPVRVHGEHGWDVHDPDGSRLKYRWVRRTYRPFVQHYVALSRQIESYLRDAVGVPAARISTLCNGVDMARFAAGAAVDRRRALAAAPFALGADAFVVGTVGRLQEVKDQALLLHAAARLAQQPALRARLRLVIVGDGPLRAQLGQQIGALGLQDIAWLAGEQADVPAWLRAFDLFALPSRSEGISNTILEAMACALPVVATRVGGNAELVEAPATGTLVPAGDATALSEAIVAALTDPMRARAQGDAGRRRVEQRFSLEAMLSSYQSMYETLLARQGVPAVALRQA